MLLWAKGLAAGGGWNVAVTEPDVSPVQVQGPRSVDLMRDLFGGDIDGLKYFWFYETELDDIPVLISRTGWSSERGYEVFLKDGRRGDELWERLMAAGAPYGVAPGAPSAIRRVEGGMLSYAADMGLDENPFEIGFGKFVCIEDHVDYLAKPALERLAASPPARRLVGLEIAGAPLPGNEHPWTLTAAGRPVGKITSAVHSPRLEKNIALALVTAGQAEIGTELHADCDGDTRRAVVVPVPFYDPKKSLATG